MTLRRATVMAAALAALIVVALGARALTPAGTSISAKATATYTNSAGTQMPSASSNTVTVTVSQVGGVEVTLPGGPTQELTPGQQGGVAFTVKNSGNGSDSFTLTASSSNTQLAVKIVKDANGDGQLQSSEASAAAVSETGTISRGSSEKLLVVVTPAAGAGTGTTANLTITAKSRFDTTKASTVNTSVAMVESKYIREWLINGTHHNPTKSSILTTDYLGGESSVAPKDGDTAAGKTWRIYRSQTDKTDLIQLFPGVTYCAAYAFTYVYSPVDVTGQIRIGSDDGNKVWVNGTAVHTNNIFRGFTADQDTAAITLKAGWNNLLVKISQGSGNWGFSARICNTSGNSIPGLVYSTVPPTVTDTTPPVISDVKVSSVSATSATISWTTNENSSTDVLYGLTSTSEMRYSNSTGVTQHHATLTQLKANTRYCFKVCSIDPAGNTAISSQYEFTTSSESTTVDYIREWLINGIHPQSTDTKILTTEYLGMESLVAPKAGDVDGGKTWTVKTTSTNSLDLIAIYPNTTYAAAYACAYIHSPVTVDAVLKIGSNDGNKVWLNGKEVWMNNVFRSFTIDQDTVPVTLQQGWNRLLLKVSQRDKGWELSTKITNTAGGLIPGLTVSTDTGDRTQPVISNLDVVSVTQSEAIIEWTTDEPATTEVGWGLADIDEQAYGDGQLTKAHTVKLTNLQPGKTYKFKVYSADVQNNVAVSDELTFTTVDGPVSPYITSWVVNGYYSNSSSSTRLSKSYISNEGSLYPYTGYTSNGKPWIKPVVTGENKIDFAATYGNPTSCAGYAHVYFYSPVYQTVNPLAGSDDGIKIWQNGKVVWTNDVYRSFKPDQDKFQLTLGAGWHRMLVKVSQGSGNWGFSLRFTDSAGNPVTNLQFTTEKPW